MNRPVLVVIPTFDEVESLPPLVTALRGRLPGVDVLVVDDASPDGTGEWADARALADPGVHVLHRPSKSGLASAYVDGFAWGGRRGYGVLVEMDADGSHRVRDLEKILARMTGPDHPDLVIGSRWVRGGHVDGWSRAREALSRAGNLYVRAALGMGVRDATAGFRAYDAGFLARSGIVGEVSTTGYGFQVEMTYATARAGGRVVEVPITFPERLHGRSKLSGGIFTEELGLVTRLGLRRLLGH